MQLVSVVIIAKVKEIAGSSDHPDKAIISLKHDRETTYGRYIEVQNEVGGGL